MIRLLKNSFAIALLLTLTACGGSEPAESSGEEAGTEAGTQRIDPASSTAAPAQATGSPANGPEERIAAGKELYVRHCVACHQPDGQGIPGAFPPLANSSWLAERGGIGVADTIVNGLSGPITVNGMEYNSVMPPLPYLSDREVADVVMFVLNSWDNPGGEIVPADVAAIRGK